MEKLKQRWGVTSNYQILIILIVFSITGTTSSYLSGPILSFLGITREGMHPVVYWTLYLLLIMPVYKVLLVSIGTAFGQKTFFVNFVRKMLQRMKLGFLMPGPTPQGVKQRVKS